MSEPTTEAGKALYAFLGDIKLYGFQARVLASVAVIEVEARRAALEELRAQHQPGVDGVCSCGRFSVPFASGFYDWWSHVA